ncbi:MAG TPA: TetR/AcrR family transcriptional regulator, partial [Solirubrobacteraceae bacterium]|nr:TetR/AcrR family transcriptional regulator [Solirubrobacteraceae bacterium]
MGGSPSLPQSGEPAGRRKSAPPATPLYKRLPHGPHRIPRNKIIQNQRARIHGAMVEAVARRGYERTSVKYVVGLAGVSRRSFYEHYANKEECFLTSVDLVAAGVLKRTSEAYRAVDGTLKRRLRAAFEQFTKEIGSDPKGVSLVITEAPMAGAAGIQYLCRATGTFEQMLLRSFAHAPEANALPLPVIRGIVGGLHEMISLRLSTGCAEEIPALTNELLRWTLLFETPALGSLAERFRVNAGFTNGNSTNGHPANGNTLNGSSSNGHATNGQITNGHVLNGHVGGDTSHLDARGRLLECALRLTVLEDYKDLSPLRIADEAGVSMDTFFDLFKDTQECFLAALDEMSDELLWTTADLELVGEDWPRAVRKAIGALMRHLAEQPLHARMIATGVYTSGPEVIERGRELTQEITTLLTEGAPEGAGGMLALEGVTGAIWHTVRCRVASGQIHLLPAIADYLAYVVLAPFIGAEAAAEIVTEEQPEPAAGPTLIGGGGGVG